ncbi:sodium/proton antiporter (NhaA family) [Antricoccus suffuscus]|uniref:Na(+)/H(+) antiporter NhaA n=1 Tax=Antricoccus suffuscus TaxID=1629062 RepID=A0A2T1A450_9ACTN|nr:Na+/H+ antiporter NhaA [Antricoccus suffuscus]PRZ43098.1 sodium/proton antiporter (NhaA family) [Antricoccus suffuscus]
MTRQAFDDAVQYLRTETIGGLVMLGAAVLALIIANTPWRSAYHSILGTEIGPAALHLDLTVSEWISDGLLAIFFFVVGLELKRELVIGQLRSVKRAMLPVFAAFGGMLVPALIAFSISHGAPGAEKAWAVPLATDIAFAVAVLAIIASNLPSGVRVFLLSVAVVDDLGAIIVIATVFTTGVSFLSLGIAAVLLVGYAALQKLRFQGALTAILYIPLGLAVWYFVHNSGIHATIAAVALGLLTRVKGDPGEEDPPAVRIEHLVQPFSSGFVVPIFALGAAGVTLSGGDLARLFTDPVAIAIMVGLVFGKPIGVFLGSFVSVKARLAALPRNLDWSDIASVGLIAGIGFTVSLLIAELAFDDEAHIAVAKTAVLLASAIASVIGAVVLRFRSRRYAHMADETGSD